MIQLDTSLAELVQVGLVEREVALQHAENPGQLDAALGLRGPP